MIKRDEAKTLRAVIDTVYTSLDVDAVLAGVVDIATDATSCHACLIYLVEGDRMVLRAASPVHKSFVGKIEMGLDEGVSGWVATKGEPALIRDEALADPRMKYFAELEEERWQSMAAIPIADRDDGAVIGVIVLHTAAPREFAEEDVELLVGIARLVGGAIIGAQRYTEVRDRVAALTRLATASRRLAAATRHDDLYEAATTGARELVGAELCQLFRLDQTRGDLRLVASDPPGAHGPGSTGGELLLELLARGRSRSVRELWPDREGSALVVIPLVASGEQLGMLCALRQRPFGLGDEELLQALGDQTAMGFERADLIANLTARDRMKDLFDGLAEGISDDELVAMAPRGLDLSYRHLIICSEGGNAEAIAAALTARIGTARDPSLHFDVTGGRLRAIVALTDATDVAAMLERADAVAVAENAAIGISAVARGVTESRQALRESIHAARIARALRPRGGALRHDLLGAYKYLDQRAVGDAPRDRHWVTVEKLFMHDQQRQTALLDTLERFLARRRSVAETARSLYIHPNTLRQRLARIEHVTGLDLAREDLLALELAIKLVRLDRGGVGS